MSIIKYSAVTVLLSVPAIAQTNGTFLLTSSNIVSPSSPITTIEIWTTWIDPTGEYGIGGANYDLTAGDGIFSNAVNVLNGPGSSTGMVAGNIVTGAVNGQPAFFPGFVLRTDNPMLLATYDWTATDFTPRTVPLGTSNTTSFILARRFTSGSVQLFPGEFTPNSGLISVVPAPAVWLTLAIPLVAIRRRRC